MQKKKFQQIVWTYYAKHKRCFAWRETNNPYHILVSEIMLQQTQTNRVTHKYNEFLTLFPTVSSLATAKLSTVLHAWMGLGYNRRARNLHETAKEIVETYKGQFPKDYQTLMSLPGIGQSTAGAIMNFAFDTATPFIETNIRTVFIHHFYKDTKAKVSDRDLLQLVDETLPRPARHASDGKSVAGREWFYALYDYGTYLKSTLAKDPSTMSRAYKRQSKFKGSFREKRSFVLRELLKSKMSKIEIQKLIKEKFGSLDGGDVVDALVKDRMIVSDKKLYQVV